MPDTRKLLLILLAMSCLAVCIAGAADQRPIADENVHLRGSFDNCRIRFERQKQGNVAFIGGSITEMDGYRPMVCHWLQERFPQTRFTFTQAGVSSTCSTTGAFRLATDVLDKGPVDLLFIEFAVNDDQDAAHSRQECIRGMEGIVRQCLARNPRMDLVITYFVNPEMLATLRAGKTPLSIAAHEEVAEHYAVSSIHLAQEVAGRIASGRLSWAQYGGVHPAPLGNAICARMIEGLFGQAWNSPLPAGAKPVPHAVPQPLDPLNYQRGRFIDPGQATVQSGWKLGVPDWAKLKGATRSRFTGIPLLCADEPGALVTLEFSGTAVGAYVVAGPDAGILEARLDDGPPREVDLYHRFSAGLHYPRTVMFAAELAPGRHRLTLRVSDKSHSQGHAARIVEFVAN
jgi:lysophospholipase L1-like esterase